MLSQTQYQPENPIHENSNGFYAGTKYMSREEIKAAYRDYYNGYVTVAHWAMDWGFDNKTAQKVLRHGRKWQNEDAVVKFPK